MIDADDKRFLARKLDELAAAARADVAEEIAAAIEDEGSRMRREDFRPGKVSLEYIMGFEAAAYFAREHAHPEVTG